MTIKELFMVLGKNISFSQRRLMTVRDFLSKRTLGMATANNVSQKNVRLNLLEVDFFDTGMACTSNALKGRKHKHDMGIR